MTTDALKAIGEGMGAAEYLTSESRKAEMLEAIKAVSKEKVAFTADDIWIQLGGVGDDRDNGSGLGPVVRDARNAGIIVGTGEFRRSERPAMHGKPIPVWRAA